jgi:hypothetical protein
MVFPQLQAAISFPLYILLDMRDLALESGTISRKV